MFLNITEGSRYFNYGGNYIVSLSICCRSYHHNDDIYHYHYYQTLLGIKVPQTNVSASVYLMGPFEALFPLSNEEIQQCHWRGSTFVKIPVAIYLLSPYLYHLGITQMHISHTVAVDGFFYTYGTAVFIKTNAGKNFL